MSSNAAQFLETLSTFEYEVVIRFSPRTEHARRKYTRLRTCRYMRAQMQLAVYDCGDASVAATNYASRACAEVARSDEIADSCGGSRPERTDMIRLLNHDYPYYVAVSLREEGRSNHRVELRYTTRRSP